MKIKYFKIFSAIVLLFLFSTCKKEIKSNAFVGNANIGKIFDVKGDFPFAYIKKPTGGYFLVYGENINYQKDVSVAVTDNKGNIIHKTTFGGSRNEAIWFTQVDANGNLYICGITRSPELRMDKNAKKTNTADGYLAKLDKDGNLLWQRGYCDTISSLKKGVNDDGFNCMYIINNKLYCIGITGSWHTPVGSNGTVEWDTWLVTFDENGNVLKDRLLPTVYKGASLLNHGGYIASDGIRLSDDDLIIRYTFMAYQSQGRNEDTTAVLCRYNIASDKVLWTKYYRQSSPQGDICYGGLLGNGNIAFFDSYWNTLNIIYAYNGDVVSTTTVNNNTASATSNQYWMNLNISPFSFNGNLYFVGYNSIGGNANNQKPYMAKLNSHGDLVLNKTFDIPQGYFYWVTENENKNLQLLGGINAFNKDNIKMFTLSTDADGNVINK